MTKKDYIKLAEVLNSSKPVHVDQTTEYYEGQVSEWNFIQTKIMQVLKNDNPNFDEDKFIEACEK